MYYYYSHPSPQTIHLPQTHLSFVTPALHPPTLPQRRRCKPQCHPVTVPPRRNLGVSRRKTQKRPLFLGAVLAAVTVRGSGGVSTRGTARRFPGSVVTLAERSPRPPSPVPMRLLLWPETPGAPTRHRLCERTAAQPLHPRSRPDAIAAGLLPGLSALHRSFVDRRVAFGLRRLPESPRG